MTQKSGETGTKAQTFEQMMERLEALVKRLESSNLSLDESIKAYEEGTKLVQECRGVLDQAEKRIQKLTQEGTKPESSGAQGGDGDQDDLPF